MYTDPMLPLAGLLCPAGAVCADEASAAGGASVDAGLHSGGDTATSDGIQRRKLQLSLQCAGAAAAPDAAAAAASAAAAGGLPTHRCAAPSTAAGREPVQVPNLTLIHNPHAIEPSKADT